MKARDASAITGVCWATAWICGVLGGCHGGLPPFLEGMLLGFLNGALACLVWRHFQTSVAVGVWAVTFLAVCFLLVR